jgi:AraC family transcriptional regulator
MRGKPSSVPIGAEHPLLIAAQEKLDESVDLASLAATFGFSPFHFHRTFTAKVGETPKEHFDRLRLEKGWLLVATTDESILQIALSVGFQSHETFTRAFKRAYAMTPTAFRRGAKTFQAARLERNRTFRGEGCTLSEVRFTTSPEMLLLAVRRVGPYQASALAPWTDEDPYWRPLAAWAEANGVAFRRVAIGVFYDIPGITPPESMRSDFAIPIDAAPADPGPYRVAPFEAGDIAVATHRGSHRTIDQAYRHVADGVRRASDRFVFSEGAPFEVIHESRIGGDPDDNITDVCFRIGRAR